jgi:hypothetical protein
MAKTTTSLRMEDDLRLKLAEAAKDEGLSVSALIERYVREGLTMAAHPGIIFKTGYSGRRAALAGGPDVWMIASALRRFSGPEAEQIAMLAAEFSIHKRQIMIALNYIASHRQEIDEWVAGNDRAAEEFEQVAAARRRLLA